MGRTERNAPMWGPPGRAYVYLCYGIHQMLNVVTGPDGEGAAVLIRGAEVLAGHETVAERRGGRTGAGSLAGPGKVGAALGLDTSWSHHDLLAPGGLELRRGAPVDEVLSGPRVGIGYASAEHQAAPWRLAVADSDQVSHRRSLQRDRQPPPPEAS
jgi:DNA-3-methyladenine glycosylase